MKIILAIFLVAIILISGLFLYNVLTQKSTATSINIFSKTDMPALIISVIGLIIAIVFSVQSNSLANQANTISNASYELAKNQGEQREDINELKNIVKGQEIQINKLTELVEANNKLNNITLEQSKILSGNTLQFAEQNELLKLSNSEIVKQLQANVRFHLSNIKLQQHHLQNAKSKLSFALGQLNLLISTKTNIEITEATASEFESDLSNLTKKIIEILNSQNDNHFLTMEPAVYNNWMALVTKIEDYEKSFYTTTTFEQKKNKIVELYSWCSTYLDAIGGDLHYYYGEFLEILQHEFDDLKLNPQPNK